MLRPIIFLKQSQISDYARMRLAALKIYGIPVRVFTEPISGFSASTFRETLKYQRDPAHYVDPGVGQLLDRLFVKFFRSTHTGASEACDQHHDV